MWQTLVSSDAGVVVLIDIAGKATILLVAGAVAAWLLRRQSAAARHTLWLCVILSVMLVPAAVLLLPGWGPQLVVGPVETPANDVAEPKTELVTRPSSPLPLSAVELAEFLEAVPPAPVEQPDPVAVSERPSPALSVWGVGSLVFVVPLVIGLVRVERVRREADRIGRGAWGRVLEQAARRLRLRREVALHRADLRGAPLTAGVLRPFILLPPGSDEWDGRRREVVLLHELAHVKRLDVLMQIITRLACCLYWFHPLVWLAARQMKIERERATDDLVLAAGARASEYSQQLIELATTSTRTPGWFPATAMAAERIQDRVTRILDDQCSRRPLSRTTCVMACLLTLGLATTVATAGKVVIRDKSGRVVATVEIPEGGSVTVEGQTGSRTTADDEAPDRYHPIDAYVLERLRAAGVEGADAWESRRRALQEIGLSIEESLPKAPDDDEDGQEEADTLEPDEAQKRRAQPSVDLTAEEIKALTDWLKSGRSVQRAAAGLDEKGRDDKPHDPKGEHALRFWLDVHGVSSRCSDCHSGTWWEHIPVPEHHIKAENCTKCHAGTVGHWFDSTVCPGCRIPGFEGARSARMAKDLLDAAKARDDAPKKPRTTDRDDDRSEDEAADDRAEDAGDDEAQAARRLDFTLSLQDVEFDGPYREFVLEQIGEEGGEQSKKDTRRASVDSQRFARDLYTLLWQKQSRDGRVSPKTARRLAQFVVNFVDSLDSDRTPTRFLYDPDLSDGWSNKGRDTVVGVEETGELLWVDPETPSPETGWRTEFIWRASGASDEEGTSRDDQPVEELGVEESGTDESDDAAEDHEPGRGADEEGDDAG